MHQGHLSMRMALLPMHMQECCNPVLGNSFVNGKMYQVVCYKNKARITLAILSHADSCNGWYISNLQLSQHSQFCTCKLMHEVRAISADNG